MAEYSDLASQALKNLIPLGDSRPRYMRLVMGEFLPECRCDIIPGHSCTGRITAEDLLCDTCRGGCCCAMAFGSSPVLSMHQPQPEISWTVSRAAPLSWYPARPDTGDDD